MKRCGTTVALVALIVLAGCSTFPKPTSNTDTMLIIPVKKTNTFGERVREFQIRIHIVNLDDSSITKDVLTYLQKDWEFLTGLPEGHYRIVEIGLGTGGSGLKVNVEFALEANKITILPYFLAITLSAANAAERTVQVAGGFLPLTAEMKKLIMDDLQGEDNFHSWELSLSAATAGTT